MSTEHPYYKNKRIEGLPDMKKETLISLYEIGNFPDIKTYAKELNISYPNLLNRIKYWRFLRSNK